VKTIRRFGNVAQAGFAQSLLEAAGVDATLADEHAFTMGAQFAPWGIRLQVPDTEAERAVALLEAGEEFAPLPDDFVRPPWPPEEPPVPARSGSALSAFLKGGMWAVGIFFTLGAFTVAAGGKVRADVGGFIFLFILGGFVGIGVSAVYEQGRRDALDPRRER
jgi:hypothetical protein